ncbi:MAG: hypothetical protein ACYTG6_17705, partial [Planctomycetota bacterium]
MRTSLLRLLPVLLLALVWLPVAVAEDPPESNGPSEEERAALRVLVDELRAEASEIRGLEWKHEVPADLLSRDQLRANLAKSIEEELDPEELARDIRIMRRLGLLTADEDPLELMLGMLEEMVGGYYDPETKRLYLIEGMTGDAQKPVILHELVHALEDQYYDLKARSEAVEDDYDRSFVEKCLQEGSAEHASHLYQLAHPDVAERHREAQNDPETAQAQIRVLSKMPATLVIGTLLWYQIGPQFVAKSVGDEYPAGIDALYNHPPESQEQLLHFDRWFNENQDWPREVTWAGDFAAAAGEGWTVWHEFDVGELDLALWLDRWLGTTKGRMNLPLFAGGQYAVADAKRAAVGWDAGRMVMLAKDDLPLAMVVAHAFDTDKDATEAADALLEVFRRASENDFQGGEWVTVQEGDLDGATARWAVFGSAFGHGRILQRGEEVLVLEGIPEETFDDVWKLVEATTFVRDERDTWDPEAGRIALETSDLVVEDLGVGINRPDASWTLERAKDRPGMVARLTKNGVTAEVVVMDQPVPLDMVLPMIEMQLKRSHPDTDSAKRVPARVGPAEGW